MGGFSATLPFLLPYEGVFEALPLGWVPSHTTS